MHRVRFVSPIVLLFVFCIAAGAGDDDGFSPEIVINLEVVTDAAVSPDASKIAYVRRLQRSPDDEVGIPYTELFVVPSAGGEPRQFTWLPHATANIQWSSDGGYIYFRSSRPEVHRGMQVYRIPSGGGEAELVTEAPSPVLAYRLSPDASKVAYIIQDPMPEPVRQRIDEGDDWRIEDEYNRHRRIHVLDLESGDTHVATRFDKSVWGFEWAPDATRILLQASPLPATDHRYMFNRMYLIDANGTDEPEVFVETEGKLGGMAFSPDGQHVAWHGAVDISDPTEGTIFVAAVESGESWKVEVRDAEVPAGAPEDEFEGTVTWVDWLDNETLTFIAEERTWTRMSTVHYRGGERVVVFDETFAPEFTSARLAEDRHLFAAAGSTYKHPGEVFSGDIREGGIGRITNHNDRLADFDFQDYEYIEYEARDGLLITGLLVKPARYREGVRYPLICQIHGGPEAAYTHGWNTTYAVMTQVYSQNGYMVFLPNYRASTGRGVGFAKANHGDGGGREFTDVLDGIGYLDGEGLIDRTRVGIVGGSYGGYFANLAATRYAGNFAAAVSWVGISNQFSKTGMSDIPLENILTHFDRAHYQDEHRVGIMEASPIWYLERAVQEENETPLLILHGEMDARVPYGQAVELYNGLRLSYKYHRGMTRDEIPVTFISYPRAGHGTHEVRQQMHFSKTVLEFFKKHLKDEEYTKRP
jgi:dipeptidyl aminopeptidase/acylaminoacyl peptidase